MKGNANAGLVGLVTWCLSSVLLLAACASTPVVSAPAGMSPQDAQRYLDSLTNTAVAVATGNVRSTAERVATAQYVQDMQTATMLPLAVQATQQAIEIAKAEATRAVKETSEREVITYAQTQAKSEITDRVDNAWAAIQLLGSVGIIISLSIAILSIGYAFSARTVPDTFQLVSFNGVPIAYRQLNTRTHEWNVTPIESGKVLEIESSEMVSRVAWWEAFIQLARAAAEYGTWSIEVLSSRDKVRGVASESAVGELRRCVGEPLGLIKDYGGSKGWDWAGSASYARLEPPSEAALGALPLPRSPEGGIKAAPIIAQAKSFQGKTSEPSQSIVQVSPKRQGRKDVRNGTE